MRDGAEHDFFDRPIVRHLLSRVRPLIPQRLSPGGRTIVYGDIMAGFQQVRRHAASHVPESDESDFHDRISLVYVPGGQKSRIDRVSQLFARHVRFSLELVSSACRWSERPMGKILFPKGESLKPRHAGSGGAIANFIELLSLNRGDDMMRVSGQCVLDVCILILGLVDYERTRGTTGQDRNSRSL
jgi:hypothetical protein